MLGEVYGVGAGSKQVQAEYVKLLARLGPELTILRETPLEEIAQWAASGWPRASAACAAARWSPKPGYDGEYGVIRVFRAAGLQACGRRWGCLPGQTRTWTRGCCAETASRARTAAS